MARKNTLASWLSQVQIRWLTLRRGEYVGADDYGNRYYRDRRHLLHGRERRWVLFKGMPEASLVPPEWHGWLHHTMDAPIAKDSPYQQEWVKPHQPNHTGTQQAYYPPGHPLEGGQRATATGDYQAWTPEA